MVSWSRLAGPGSVIPGVRSLAFAALAAYFVMYCRQSAMLSGGIPSALNHSMSRLINLFIFIIPFSLAFLAVVPHLLTVFIIARNPC